MCANRVWPFSYFIFAVLLLTLLPAAAKAADIVVIVNQTVKVSKLTATEVRQIFTARQQYWSDGSKISVFVLDANSPVHQAFCREQLKMFPYQIERLWNQITFSGQGDPPTKLNSQSELIEAVLSTPGAIGYALDDTPGPQPENKVEIE